MSKLRRVVGAGVLATVAVVPIVPSDAQPVDPTVTIDRTGTASGEELLVTGNGWSKGATLVVELCGQGGIHGSTDCDVPNQRTAGVGASGTFSVNLTVGNPAVPVPCPCVVKATDQATHIAATGAISVQDVPTVPITDDDPDAVRRIEISALEVTGGGAWTELFGAPSDRSLQVTLTNTGAVAVRRPSLTVAWGKGEEPTGFVEVPDLEAMEPGDIQKVAVDLPRGALSFGQYRAIAEVQGLAEPVRADTTTSTYPWGLIALAVLLVQLLLLRIRNRLRRRFQPPGPVVEDQPAGETLALPKGAVAALPAGEEVIDLREPVEVDLTAPAEVPEVVDAGVVPLDSVPSANGNGSNGQSNNGHAANGNGHDGNGHAPAAIDLTDVDGAEAHRTTTAWLTLELLSAFGTATADARQQAEELHAKARSSLQQSTNLSEALVAAAGLRAEELRAGAEARDDASQEQLSQATEVLAAARARADELVAAAEAAAAQIKAAAEADRNASRQALASVDREREELIDAARAAIDRILADLDERTASLSRDLERQATRLLAQASEERRSGPVFHDELDRRLARAVNSALHDS